MMSLRTPGIGLVAGMVICLWAAAAAMTQAAQDATEALAILQQNCVKCHGGEKTRGGLKLTSRELLLQGGEHGQAIELTNPDQSLLLKMVRWEDDDHQMPPKGKLPASQIDVLTRWVKQGAPWGDAASPASPQPAQSERNLQAEIASLWSVKALVRPAVPAVQDKAWVRTPVDAFILHKLEDAGLKPAKEADRRVLIRRATYDLTGLPPTPAEVEAFVQDPDPQAYEKLVDRLLASPHYGEKWGRHWLDLVRFAETNSFERDNPKPHAWRYRDYVIRSFNDDKPYDRFITEQIAGDELPDANSDALVATGFHRLGLWDDEPADRELAEYEVLNDILSTTGEVMLGLTVGCARCHDHKIDPFPAKDYYRLLAFFRNINPYRNGGETDEALLFASEKERQQYLDLQAQRKKQADQTQQEITKLENEFREKLASQGDEAPAAADLDQLRYRYYRDTWKKLPDFSVIKPEREGEVESRLFDLRLRDRDRAIGFVFEGLLIVPSDGEYTFHLNSDDGARLTVAGQVVVEHDGIHGVEPLKKGKAKLGAGRVPIKLEYFQNVNGLGLKVAWTGPGVPLRPLSAPDNADADRMLAPGKDKQDIAKMIAGAKGEELLGEAEARRYKQLRSELKDLEKPAEADKALVVTERGSKATATFVLIRGNPGSQGAKVEPGFPMVLGGQDASVPAPTPQAKSTGRRLVLAQWLVSPENPLPARVMANRLFQYHFGRGIVRSSNNFGVQGDKPTHPELLDYLACELRDGGWRLKRMHKLIMTSSAYRMSSEASAQALAKDAANDLLWRFDMRRLTAEEIRDSILAASGSLNLAMYGPSVYPPIPREVLAGQSVPGKGWPKSSEPDASRRSVYVHQKRSLRLPILEAFDAADVDTTCPVRFVSTPPTQALVLLNSEMMQEQAKRLAERLRREAGEGVEARIRLAISLVTQRPATQDEVSRSAKLIEDLVAKDGATPEQAWRHFCLMALNLNEFVYLD